MFLENPQSRRTRAEAERENNYRRAALQCDLFEHFQQLGIACSRLHRAI